MLTVEVVNSALLVCQFTIIPTWQIICNNYKSDYNFYAAVIEGFITSKHPWDSAPFFVALTLRGYQPAKILHRSAGFSLNLNIFRFEEPEPPHNEMFTGNGEPYLDTVRCRSSAPALMTADVVELLNGLPVSRFRHCDWFNRTIMT